MKINKPEIAIENGIAKISCSFEFESGEKTIAWFSVSDEYAEFLNTESIDSFLLIALPIAMKNQEDVLLNAPVSKKLYYNITSYYMDIISTVIPSLKKVKITADTFLEKPIVSKGCVATGFSAGVDSSCAFLDHNGENNIDGYKITHFLFNDVGSHGRGEKSKDLFHKRYNRLLECTKELGIPFIKIDSNVDEVLNMSFQQTHSFRNVAVALLFPKLFSKYIYASSYRYSDCVVAQKKDTAFSDPITLPLLSTETIDCIASGSQYSRVEKTEKIASWKPSYKYLDVCVNDNVDEINCSTCFKCKRTMLTLEIFGKLDLYDQIFDIKKYEKIRL